MNNAAFWKTMKNARKQRYRTCNNLSKKRLFELLDYYLSIWTKLSYIKILKEMKKVQMFVNKPVFLGPSILELSEIVTYEF